MCGAEHAGSFITPTAAINRGEWPRRCPSRAYAILQRYTAIAASDYRGNHLQRPRDTIDEIVTIHHSLLDIKIQNRQQLIAHISLILIQVRWTQGTRWTYFFTKLKGKRSYLFKVTLCFKQGTFGCLWSVRPLQSWQNERTGRIYVLWVTLKFLMTFLAFWVHLHFLWNSNK